MSSSDTLSSDDELNTDDNINYETNIPSEFRASNINNHGYIYNNYINNDSNISISDYSNLLNINNFEENNDLENISEVIRTNLNNAFNENIPLVLKSPALQQIEVKKYMNLSSELKKQNKKCMISLDNFKNQPQGISNLNLNF